MVRLRCYPNRSRLVSGKFVYRIIALAGGIIFVCIALTEISKQQYYKPFEQSQRLTTTSLPVAKIIKNSGVVKLELENRFKIQELSRQENRSSVQHQLTIKTIADETFSASSDAIIQAQKKPLIKSLVKRIKKPPDQSFVKNLKKSADQSFVKDLKKPPNGPFVKNVKKPLDSSFMKKMKGKTKSLTSSSKFVNTDYFNEDIVSDQKKGNTVNFTNTVTRFSHRNLPLASPKKRLIKDYLKDVASYVPSIPLTYLRHIYGYEQSACNSFPNLYYLHINNYVWQQFQAPDGTNFYIYGAYYDDRRILKQPVVRMLAMVDRISPPAVICRFWWPDAIKSKLVKASSHVPIWLEDWGNYMDGFLLPYLITCPLEALRESSQQPESISLVSSSCENATNNIRIFDYRPTTGSKHDFAVCVKGLNFRENDISVRLVEWIELLKLLGAHKIFFYELVVHPNVSRVLDYYVDSGLAERTLLTLPGMQMNFPEMLPFFFEYRKTTKRQNEIVPYNDCFYKNIHRYKYVVLLDIDEVIIPLQTSNWADLIKDVVAKATAVRSEMRDNFPASNVYFFDDAKQSRVWHADIPDYMHMLQHVWRVKNHTANGSFSKSFFNTENVLTLHNHFPLHCSKKRCLSFPIPTEMAQLQHYRKGCDDMLEKECQEEYKMGTVRDDSILKFRNPLIKNVKKALNELGFLQSAAWFHLM